MNAHNRFAFFSSLLSPEQQEELSLVQAALEEDPMCLEKKKHGQPIEQEKEDA